ncbi:hypothetical protein [Streptoalloteichus hindustanus]|uniref:Uncharacterized protein n=1 Tax=Streptoalloteichus hindustanus TaxID=2017 RepID=A0A1M5MA78_STRHI|nr:hypothetical protein [Streptoalloteichus hindustanus]SHG74207.1 hypothetical protein SAMN05444320_11349 [Streptoalloteichus hindustanus]
MAEDAATLTALPSLSAWISPPPPPPITDVRPPQGYVPIPHGWLYAWERCPECRGRGELVFDHPDDGPHPEPCDCLWDPLPEPTRPVSLAMPHRVSTPDGSVAVALVAAEPHTPTPPQQGGLRILLRHDLYPRGEEAETEVFGPQTRYVVLERATHDLPWQQVTPQLTETELQDGGQRLTARPLPVHPALTEWLDTLLSRP